MINKFLIINIIRKYEVIFASGVVLLAVTGASFIFLWPSFNRAKLIFEQKSQLQKQLDKLKQKNNALSDLDSKYYQGILTNFYRILPDGKDYISLFETLDGLETKTKVRTLKTDFPLGFLSGEVSMQKKSQGESVYILPIAIDIRGDFSSLQKYLEALNDLSGRIIVVDSVSMKIQPTGIYTLSIAGNTYVVPAPGTIGSLDSSIPKINKSQQELLDKIAKIKIDTYQTAAGQQVPVGKKNLFD